MNGLPTPQRRTAAIEPAAMNLPTELSAPIPGDDPGADREASGTPQPGSGGRFAQLTYTAFHQADGSGAGWQVKNTLGEVTATEQALVVDRISTKLDAVPKGQGFLTHEEIDLLPRRLVYAPLGERDADGMPKKNGAMAWWHTAAAGMNSSRRPNNVFVHVVLDRTPALPQPPLRPSDLLRAPQWLRPHGHEAVLATTLDGVPPLPWADPVMSAATAAEFIEYAAVHRPGTLAHLLDAVVGALQGDQMAVLGVDEPERADQWIAAICHLMSPNTSRGLAWSTAERADSITTARAMGLHLVALPIADLAAVELDENEVVLVSDAEEAGELGDLRSGEPHVTASGSRIAVTPWSAIAAAVGNLALTREALMLQDRVAQEVNDAALTCAWPLAMAVAQMSTLRDVTDEAMLAVSGPPPPGLKRGSALDKLRRVLLSGELGHTTADAWAAVSKPDARSSPGWIFAANTYLERAVTDADWLTKSPPAPVPGIPPSAIDDEVFGKAERFLGRLASQIPAGDPAHSARSTRSPVALVSLRLLDFVVRSHMMDPQRVDPGQSPFAELIDWAGRLMADDAAGPALIERIGPIDSALRAMFLRPWFDRYLDRATGRLGCRLAPPVLEWLLPEPVPRDDSAPVPATLAEAAAQATLVFGDPAGLRSVALDAALRRSGEDLRAVRRLGTAPPLPVTELRTLLKRHHPAALAAALASTLLSCPHGPDLQSVLDLLDVDQQYLRAGEPDQQSVLLAANLRRAQAWWWRQTPTGVPDAPTQMLDAAEQVLVECGEPQSWSTDLTCSTAAAQVVEHVAATTSPPARPSVWRRLRGVFGADKINAVATATSVADHLDYVVFQKFVSDFDLVVVAQAGMPSDANAIGRPWLATLGELRLAARPTQPALLDWIIHLRMFDGRFRPNADFVHDVQTWLKNHGAGDADHAREWWGRVGVTDEATLAPLASRKRWL